MMRTVMATQLSPVCRVIFLGLASVLLFLRGARAVNIFPEPREMRVSRSSFKLGDTVSIVVPVQARDADRRLARLLSAELSSRHGIAIHQESAAHLPAGRPYLLMGTIDNPLVKEYCAAHGLNVSASQPGPEGYILSVTPNAVVIAGSDERGCVLRLADLRQLIESDSSGMRIPGVSIRDWPYYEIPWRQALSAGARPHRFFQAVRARLHGPLQVQPADRGDEWGHAPGPPSRD